MLSVFALDLLCLIVDEDAANGHGPTFPELISLSGLDAGNVSEFLAELTDTSQPGKRLVGAVAKKNVRRYELNDRERAIKLAAAHIAELRASIAASTPIVPGRRSRRSSLAGRLLERFRA